MFFQKKLNRAMEWQRQQNADRAGEEFSDEELPSMEELMQEEKRVELEKSDLPALIISALITFVPLCIVILLILCVVVFLFI